MLLRSWIYSANAPEGAFPLNNLPFGVGGRADEPARCIVAIGDLALDLMALERKGLLRTQVFHEPSLNAFMALGPACWAEVRAKLTSLLAEGGESALREDAALADTALIPQAELRMRLPFTVAGYTDFYAGRHHAQNVGTMFRGSANALPPNWLSIPIGYNGRASTVVVSGTPIRRPLGQTKAAEADLPSFGPSRQLDIELELGAVVGQGTELGSPVSVAEADALIFGYVLLNDWSARDIQAWEYQPLGPFQSKAFATSISPWIVTRAALEPFRVSGPQRERPLLPYLREPGPMLYDIALEVRMRAAEQDADTVIARTNYREMYYSAAQQLAHHAIGGCRMQVGDLLGSGTISGPARENRGSLLELTWGGREPISLGGGIERRFIEDGDILTLTGFAQGEGYRIGFGSCLGQIDPAPFPIRQEWRDD
ncbi:fumarylacetoacetase [Acidisoma sp. 7E03]